MNSVRQLFGIPSKAQKLEAQAAQDAQHEHEKQREPGDRHHRMTLGTCHQFATGPGYS